MSEFSSVNEHESTGEVPLNKETILSKLFEVADELGIDIEEVDLEDLAGQDDNDFLGNLATLALMHGLDHEDFFDQLGVHVERAVELDPETE